MRKKSPADLQNGVLIQHHKAILAKGQRRMENLDKAIRALLASKGVQL